MKHPLVDGLDDLIVVARSGVLDPEWYRAQNRDVAAAGVDPYEHYLAQGWREGRDPGPAFRNDWYLQVNPDVVDHGINPLVHYLNEGWREGRLPSPGFVAPPEAALVPDICPLVLALALAGSEGTGAAPNRLARMTRPAAAPSALAAAEPPAALPLRTVAFYLPQFHAIPENDEWWGEGFTEWRNVERGTPRFPGHEQPHVPSELGEYHLLDPLVMARQVELAVRHGVTAFCFYAYWFGGRRLLERPLDVFLADASLELGFCVCWANENWTRTWDGEAHDVLIEQQHSPGDDLAFIESMAGYLRDPRYLRVGGRPVLLVYRPSLLPDPAATAERWRGWCREHGIGEIVLATVQSFERRDPQTFGFDVAVEFPPNATDPRVITEKVGPDADFEGVVYDGRELVARSLEPPAVGYPLWRGVCTSWDNEARRPGRGAVLHGLTPTLLRDWLVAAGRDTVVRHPEPDDRLVFINAWNEWAEGAHLEPDERHGFAWLNAVRDAQEQVAGVEGTGPGVVVVVHDLHPHGAQLGGIALARELRAMGRRVEIVALGAGRLAEEAERVAPLHVLDDSPGRAARDLADDLVSRGFTTALCNSAVTGPFAAVLRKAGTFVVGLVHELPGVLAVPERAEAAALLPAAAQRLVFPADVVRDRFPFEVPAGCEVVVRHQGAYRRPAGDRSHARTALRTELGVPTDARLVVALGYGDHRKGIDLLVRALDHLPTDVAGREVHVVWVGGIDRWDERVVDALGAITSDRLHLVDFVDDPSEVLLGADVLALPSREDPFPTVVLEALAVGLPVVALAGATGCEALIGQTDGLLVVATPEALAAGLVAALERCDDEAAAARRSALVDREAAWRPYVLDLLHGTPAALPRVSVVVPSYQYAPLLADRLEQVFGQTYPVYEVVVLDDASTDGSDEVIAAATRHRAPAVEVVLGTANSGSVFRQWAAGVARTSGDLVWIAEADDVADPAFLARLVPRATGPGVVLAYCQSRQLGPDGQELAPDYLDYVADVDARDWHRPYLAEGADELADCLAVKNTIPNVSAVLMSGPVLRDALAGLDDLADRYPTAGDWRVYAEVLQHGRIAFEPLALNGHRRHDDSVIARHLGADHVAEIAAMQQRVAALVPVPAPVRAAAEAYLADVAARLIAETG